MRRTNRRGGMTPSETLFAAALLAGLALVAFFRFQGGSEIQARRTTIRHMNAVMEGLRNYAVDNNVLLPTTDQGLKALLEKPSTEPVPRNWRGPYLPGPEYTRDGWGAPLHYILLDDKGTEYHLWSNGADKREGGTGADADIQSWNPDTMTP